MAYEDGNEENWFTLKELSDKSVSNPEIRRGEMFVRIRGFEDIARESDHAAIFLTATAPSRFHPVSGGKMNPKWLSGGRPDAKTAHQHIMGVWQALGKLLAKHKIHTYGMRIVEPHQDGTPHHHYLLFLEPKHRDFVVSEFRRLSLKDSPSEKGAQKHRFTCEHIDFKKGSAVGYVAKYLSKNIDGQHIEQDKGSNLQGTDAAERVVTWSRVNQIRQFQFIGGPSVSVWREMRRLREEFNEEDAMFSDLNNAEHYILEKVRRAADDGDWKAFCYAMGGVIVNGEKAPVKLHYMVPRAIEKICQSDDAVTQYGDAAQARINGLMFKNVYIMTRFRKWKVTDKKVFERSRAGVMSNLVDWFDVMERNREYEYMLEDRFQQYEDRMQYCEHLEAVYVTEGLEGLALELVGAAPPTLM